MKKYFGLSVVCICLFFLIFLTANKKKEISEIKTKTVYILAYGYGKTYYVEVKEANAVSNLSNKIKFARDQRVKSSIMMKNDVIVSINLEPWKEER